MHIHSQIYAEKYKNKPHTPRMMGPQYMGFGDLFIIGISGENVIGVEDGNHDQRGKTRSEAAVEENEAAVHACRGRAYDRVDQTCEQTLLPSVLSRNRAKTGGKGNAVDICLRGKHPRNGSAEESIYNANEGKERDVAENNGSDITRMLPVCGKCQRRKKRTDRGTRKSCGHGQLNGWEDHAEKIGHDEDDIQVCKKAKAVDTEVDKANGHSEFR